MKNNFTKNRQKYANNAIDKNLMGFWKSPNLCIMARKNVIWQPCAARRLPPSKMKKKVKKKKTPNKIENGEDGFHQRLTHVRIFKHLVRIEIGICNVHLQAFYQK